MEDAASPIDEAAAQLYLRRMGSVVLALLGVLALFNLSADGYGIYRNLHLPHLRTEPIVWSRVSAAERVSADCQVVLMGSSRVMHGFGPKIPKWGNREVCNGALGGTSIKEQRRVWDYVLRQRSVRYAILFLDFHLFNDARGNNGDYVQSRFNRSRSRLTYHMWGLTSWDAIKASFRVLGHPLPYVDEQYEPMSQVKANKVELYRFFKNPHLYKGWQGDDETMAVLASMLRDADRAHIKVILVIPPVHAMLAETEEMMGVWNESKDWRRRLVELLAERNGSDIPLWDFSTFSAPVVSPMPIEPGDPINPWWIDVSHQSAQLGWMTMARLTDSASGLGQTWEDSFGVKLTPENIDAHLAALDEGRARYVHENPAQIAWLKAWGEKLEAMPSEEYDDLNDAGGPGEFNPKLPD